jgi:hypothetical protein
MVRARHRHHAARTKGDNAQAEGLHMRRAGAGHVECRWRVREGIGEGAVCGVWPGSYAYARQ